MEHGYSKYTNERCRCSVCRAAWAAYQLAYRRKNPRAAMKHRVRSLAQAAVKRGDLIPQPCEVCGGSEVQAHHDDYTKALDVRWLCRVHHRARDLEIDASARGCSPHVRVIAKSLSSNS